MSPLLSALAFVLLAPLAGGLLAGADRVVTARMQGRIGPPLLQPFFDLGKLLSKEVRTVNGLAEPLLLGHVVTMALAGALVVGGGDLLLATFVFALSSLLLTLAAGSADSPFGSAGAERELVALLATEPLLILLAALVCRVTGASTLPGVLASPVKVALALPGVLLAFLVVVTIKLRKSPFDLSTSHHAHQELVRGLTSDMSARLLAWVELGHWIETVLLGLFVLPLLQLERAPRDRRRPPGALPRDPRGQRHRARDVAAHAALGLGGDAAPRRRQRPPRLPPGVVTCPPCRSPRGCCTTTPRAATAATSRCSPASRRSTTPSGWA
ncbi:MAG: NADH-quinone oxidoreductase subunit H [Anaeromyxobacteraceae bacterium]